AVVAQFLREGGIGLEDLLNDAPAVDPDVGAQPAAERRDRLAVGRVLGQGGLLVAEGAVEALHQPAVPEGGEEGALLEAYLHVGIGGRVGGFGAEAALVLVVVDLEALVVLHASATELAHDAPGVVLVL